MVIGSGSPRDRHEGEHGDSRRIRTGRHRRPRACRLGGSVANLPVGVAQKLGAKSIIAVDITSPLTAPGQKLKSFLDVYGQTNNMLTVQNRREDVDRLGENDIYIRPNLEGIGFLSFDRAEDMVSMGAAAARDKSDQLSRFAASDSEWQSYMERQRRPPSDTIWVDRVRLDNDGRLSDHIETRALGLDPPVEVASDQLRDDIMRLNDLQPSGVISFEVEDDDGEKGAA